MQQPDATGASPQLFVLLAYLLLAFFLPAPAFTSHVIWRFGSVSGLVTDSKEGKKKVNST